MSEPALSRGSLTAEQVRNACIADSTKKSYKSYLNTISMWIRKTQNEPERFFRTDDGAINISVFTPDVFDAFAVEKLNSKALKVGTLGGYRSAVKALYAKYRVPLPDMYQSDLKTLFKGMNRIETSDIQDQGSQDKTGKQPLTYALYEQLCVATLGRLDNGFTHLFLTTQWNLMCRSKSVETIHISHLQPADDSIGCVLHKTKTNQEGSGPKDPRHMYANPLSPQTCWVLALGFYLASNPAMTAGKLFPGRDQKSRFSKSLSTLLTVASGSKAYGTHSIRKGVATFACSASTGGPSIVSVCLRCGWSLGNVQDRYFRYESAGDQYLGRVVAGLPINSHKFAVLPPHFMDSAAPSVQAGIVTAFPVLGLDPALRPILQLCLASLIEHTKFLETNIPTTHQFRSSKLWCNPELMSELRSNLSSEDSTWMRPTGIPPHIHLYVQQQQTKDAINKLPDILMKGFSDLLEQSGHRASGVTASELKEIMQTLLAEAGLPGTRAARAEPVAEPTAINTVHYWKQDQKYHRLKEDFKLPSVDARTAWRLWWFGNRGDKFPPLRSVQTSDFATQLGRSTYSEWTMVMKHITTAYEAEVGIERMQWPQTPEEADEQYTLALRKLPIPAPSNDPSAKPLRAVTVLKNIRVAMKKATPNPRVIPFRKRKRAKKNL